VLTAGNPLGDALMRPGRVVVDLVFDQDRAQMRLAEDEHAPEELAAQGTEEAFAGRVHPGSLNGGPQDPDADRSHLYPITHFTQSAAYVIQLKRHGPLPYQSARILKFPQFSSEMISQGHRLPIYSIRRCGARADVGQWVVSVLG